MTGGSKVVKITARTALKGNMLKAIIASGVFLFCYFIANYSAGIFSYTGINTVSYIILILMILFLLAPLLLGFVRFIWRMLFSADDSPVSVFYYLSEKNLYIKSVKFTFNLILKAIPVGILLFLPVILLWVFTQGAFYDLFGIPMPLWTANLNTVIRILIVFAIVSLSFYMVRYYLAPVLFVADENMDINETFYMSNIIARKSSLDFIYLFSSFLGWILLSLLVIPLIFTLPYMATAYAVHSRFAIAEYNKHISFSANEGVMYGVQ